VNFYKPRKIMLHNVDAFFSFVVANSRFPLLYPSLRFIFVIIIIYLPSCFLFISFFRFCFPFPSSNIVFLLVLMSSLRFGSHCHLFALGSCNIPGLCWSWFVALGASLLVCVWVVGLCLSHFCSCSWCLSHSFTLLSSFLTPYIFNYLKYFLIYDV